MKKLLLFFILLTGMLIQAQTSNVGFNFKGIVMDNGIPVANSTITVKVNIWLRNIFTNPPTNVTLWMETHNSVQTDANGIFSIIMGEGTRTGGNVTEFKDVNWDDSLFPIKYDVIVNAGNGDQTLVNGEYFKYVPYAKQAEIANQAKSVSQLSSLGVGDSPNNSEIVRFRRDNPISTDDVLDLEMNQAPTSGTAQFIECNLDIGTVFKVDHNGDIYTNGELHASTSGDADMKAYAYGYVFADGTIRGGTSNFTVNKVVTGEYEITLTGGSTIDDTNCFIVATPSSGAGNAGIRAYVFSNKIYVKTMGDTGATQVDKSFQFVVFKK